jgi:hypothetical protein
VGVKVVDLVVEQSASHHHPLDLVGALVMWMIFHLVDWSGDLLRR